MAAVFFLGESFSFVNGVGLAVLICGVALFNWFKYQKIVSGEAKGSKAVPDKVHGSAGKGSADDEETGRLVGGARLSVGAHRNLSGPLVVILISMFESKHTFSLMWDLCRIPSLLYC
jgi:hypothetical protein